MRDTGASLEGAGPRPSAIPVALALGSNLGDRLAHLASAIAALRGAVQARAVSSVYESDPVGYQAQPPFLNAVLVGDTRLAPSSLLALALDVEAAAGRVRTFAGAPRPLDVDVILYGEHLVRTPDLVVPHARWRQRGFVLVPLAEVAPDWRDPETGRTVAMLAEGDAAANGRPRRVAPPSALWRGERAF